MAACNMSAPAALAVMTNKTSITIFIVDNPGVFRFCPDRNTPNSAHSDVVCPSAVGIYLEGNQSRLSGNLVRGSKAESAIIRGNGNVLIGNTSDGDVTIEGENNIVCAHFFTSASAWLVLKGAAAANSTQVYAVPPERIVRMP